MRTIRTGILVLLCCALLLAAFGCKRQDANAIGDDTAILTVGTVPVYALTYRYQLSARYDTIEKNKLYDYDTYLAYVVNPGMYYPYPYRDTHTEDGLKALGEDILSELALEAASIFAAEQAGYTLSVEDRSYLAQAEQDAKNALEEVAESYDSIDAFYAETGLSEQTFVRMYTRSREASIDFNKLLADYRDAHPIDEEALETGYARIVKETFRDRYKDGMYSQYLAHYIAGTRNYPSLYIPDDAIFVRLFVYNDPTDAQIAAFTERAEQDFESLYQSADNAFTAQGTVGDVAVAPKDELLEGLYDSAKDVPIGQIGSHSVESDGKTAFCLFLRVEGETGLVSIDRYPGMRERITSQLTGTFCMDTLRALVADPAVTTRDDARIAAIRPEA